MRHVVAMAAIPAAVWAAYPAPTPRLAPLKPTAPIEIEGVRAARLDDQTFRVRWSAVTDMPPATEVRYASDGGVVSTVPAVSTSAPQPVLPRGRLHSRPVRLDICARHRMRKVFYGRTWRCRR